MQRHNHLPYAYSRRLRNKGWHHNASLVCVCMRVCARICVCVRLFFKRSLQGKISVHLRGLYFISGTEGDKMAPFWVGKHNRRNGEVATKTKRKENASCDAVCMHTHRGKEAKSPTFVACAQTQLNTKLNIWNTSPALLISASCLVYI